MSQHTASDQLIGRDAELEMVIRAAAIARAGQPRVLVITGEAGIGKTRLVSEAVGRLRRDGDLVLFGACLDIGDGGLPYLPIAQALRGLVRDLPSPDVRRLVGPAREDVELIVPGLFATHAGEQGSNDDRLLTHQTAPVPSGYGQARLFERLLGLLGRLAGWAPTLLVIEDAHWIDRATRDLLTFVLGNLTHERLAIVLTSRVDDLPRGHPTLAWLADIGRSPRALRVDLHRLEHADVVRQIRFIHGRLPREDIVERIWRRSEGIPLFVEELSSAITASPPGDGADHLVEILLARVQGASQQVRDVLATVAVAGRPVEETLITEILDWPAIDVRSGLRVALERGALVVDEASGTFRFRHELLREAVEKDLMPGELRAIHERYAVVLTHRARSADPGPAAVAAELAHHWAAAGRASEAYQASVEAGDAAVAIHAHVLAHQQFERALDLEARSFAGAPRSLSERIALRRAAADAADLAGEPERALELTNDTLALVDESGDPLTAAVLHSRLGYLSWLAGDSTTALAEHRRAVELVPTEPTPERARVLGALGGALMGLGRWVESRSACESAIACAAACAAPAEESRARNMLGSDLVALGEIDDGIRELQEACRLASEAGIVELVVVGHHNLALNLLQVDRFEEALAAASHGRVEAREQGLERRFGQDLAALEADVLLRLGRWDEADRVTGEGLALDPRSIGTTYLSTVRARLLALRGQTAAAVERLAAIVPASLDPDVAAYVAGVTAEAALLESRPADALKAVLQGLGYLDGLLDVLWTAPLVGIGLRATADHMEQARSTKDGLVRARILEAATGLADRLPWLAERATTLGTQAWLETARAEARRVDGSAAPADWIAAIEAWDSLPDPYAAAYCRVRRAEVALRRVGIRAPVQDALDRAHEAVIAMGALPLRRHIEALAIRARVTLRSPSLPRTAGPAGEPAPDAAWVAARALGLSGREIEVLMLVAVGHSNGEIADRLFISRKTAAVHVTHILDKLGVVNRFEAAMVAAQIGFVVDDGPGGAPANGQASAD